MKKTSQDVHPMHETATIITSGQVQRVGFREKLAQRARTLHLAGTVENLPDGRVRIVARGTRDSVEALVRGLGDIDPLARAVEPTVTWARARGRATQFRVLYGPAREEQATLTIAGVDQLAGVNTRLDSMDGKLGSMDKKLTDIDGKLTGIDGTLKVMGVTIAGRFDRVDKDHVSHDTLLRTLQESLTVLDDVERRGVVHAPRDVRAPDPGPPAP